MKTTLFLLIGLTLSCKLFSQADLVNANNHFTFTFFKAIKPDSSNFFISPLSLNIALAIADEGARGTTKDEIDRLLNIKGIANKTSKYKALIDSTTNLNDAEFKECMKWRKNKEDTNTLCIANAIWYNKKIPIKPEFFKTTVSDYYTKLHAFDPKNILETNENINDWVAKETNNKIKTIPGVNSFTVMNIINVTYFLGKWENEFDVSRTRPKKFYSLRRDSSKIDFMNKETRYDYYEDNKIQAVYLPYKCNQFSMLIILPRQRYGINHIESMLDSAYYNQIRNKAALYKVILSVPKFKIETNLNLADKLKAMGYNNMFSPKANFSGISNSFSYIDQITQKTFIQTDEKKTEAAAVTVIGMEIGAGIGVPPPPPPKVFNANHPFTFLIIDNRTKAILFIGRFVKQKIAVDQS